MAASYSDINQLLVTGKRYATIYADPPWHFAAWSARGLDCAAAHHYETMSLDAICALPVADLAADDSVLFLWCVSPMLPEAIAVISAWGFTYKSIAFAWAKRTPRNTGWHMGLGYWTRSNVEFCLLATRGKPKRLARDVRQLVVDPRRRHSEKPEEVAARIQRLVAGSYLELFARRSRPGWTSWGDQVDALDAPATPERKPPVRVKDRGGPAPDLFDGIAEPGRPA